MGNSITERIDLSNDIGVEDSEKPLFLVFGIEFLQEVNGSFYALNNGAFNALNLVLVDKVCKMKVDFLRMYSAQATNGEIWWDGSLVCYTIELPWRGNARNISCIPEGRYRLKKRFSEKFRWHVSIEGVPERSAILFHAANDVNKEFRGCIAPVSELIRNGKGLGSRKAFEMFRDRVFGCIDSGLEFWLTILKK